MDDKDTTIMLHLLSNPNASNKDISTKTGISEATVSRRIKQLYKRKIILGKQLVINKLALGLDVYSIFFKIGKNWRKSIIHLQFIFKQHAYTSYQCKVFGLFSGLLVQLSLPKDSEDVVAKLVEGLKEMKIIDDAQIYRQSGAQIRFNIDPDLYDEESRSFLIDFKKIRKSFSKDRDEFAFQHVELVSSILSKENIRLIGELHQDATRSLAKIGEKLGITKQEVSRRKISYSLDDWGYDTLYDRREFGVFNQCFFVFDNNLTEVNNLYNLLSKHYPFQASIIPNGDFILLWINLPAINVMQFCEIIQQRFETVEFFMLARNPKNYPPWDENISGGRWNDEEQRILKVFKDDNFTQMVEISEFVDLLDREDLYDLEERFDQN